MFPIKQILVNQKARLYFIHPRIYNRFLENGSNDLAKLIKFHELLVVYKL